MIIIITTSLSYLIVLRNPLCDILVFVVPGLLVMLIINSLIGILVKVFMVILRGSWIMFITKI
jgi:hypothetical protein